MCKKYNVEKLGIRSKVLVAAVFALGALAVLSEDGGAVKYRGIFVNDEDWGLRPWAVRHFGKEHQIGTKVYELIFGIMKSDGLNLIWPAMHEGGYEFVSRPENMELATQWGITVGTSHCEPMLRNNCYLSADEKKQWSWTRNSEFVGNYWRWAVDRYAKNDVFWTIGMRGIHDGKMNDGETMDEKVAVLESVFAAQCGMLKAAGAGDAPKLFVPYKEVLPIYNAGLNMPKGTTIMWVDDNFGYVRRLGGPQCDGHGQGIYWHVSYYGRPHSYNHLCTTPPAFMWYELVAKCFENGVRDVWVVNVGDVFQADISMFALGKFAGDPEYWLKSLDPQNEVIGMWVRERFFGSRCNVDEKLAERIVAHLDEYYNLGFIRKPEHMCVQWSSNLPLEMKEDLLSRYRSLLAEDVAIENALPQSQALRDAYFRYVGFQVRFLAHAGLIHLKNMDMECARKSIDPLYWRWDAMEDGKWSGFWCDTIDENNGTRRWSPYFNHWSSHMQWTWNEPKGEDGIFKARPDYTASAFCSARESKREPQWLEPFENTPMNDGAWTAVNGLGTSGRALALLPVKAGVGVGAVVKYQLNRCSCEQNAKRLLVLQFLPDFALWPGLQLRVNVAFDDNVMQDVNVPGADCNIGERDPVRNASVQDNFIRVSIPVPEGARIVAIRALDPGVVLDRVGIE